jgi:hypothetical protein
MQMATHANNTFCRKAAASCHHSNFFGNKLHFYDARCPIFANSTDFAPPANLSSKNTIKSHMTRPNLRIIQVVPHQKFAIQKK